MKFLLASFMLLTASVSFAQKKLYPYRVKDKFGYSDEKKKILIDPAYYQAYPFYEGLARVKVINAVNKVVTGFIDEKGKQVIPPAFYYASDFTDGKAIVQARTGYGLIDKKGKVLIDTFQRSLYYDAKAKLYKAEGQNKNFCFYDKNGKQLFPYNFTWLNDYAEGLAPARDANNQYGYINIKGEWVIGPNKDYVFVKPFSDGVAGVTLSRGQDDGNEMYIDKTGKQAVTGYFRNAGPFKDGIASVNYGGYINKKGEKLFTEYNSTTDFRGGLASARNTARAGNSTIYLIDRSGKQLAEVIYNGGDFLFGEEGNIIKRSGYKYGLIDRKGKTLIECKYDQLRMTRSGLLYVYFQDKNYNDVITGYVGETGVEYWEE